MKFVYPILLLLILFLHTSLAIDPIRNLISRGSDNTSANIDHLLAELISKANSTGYVATSYGEGQHEVYGLAQCRRDASRKDCSTCLQDIAAKHQLCPNRQDATNWYDHCYLRYSKENFFGKVNTSENIYLYNKDNVTDPQDFARKRGALMDKVISQAVVPKNKGLGKAKAKWSTNETLYAMAQCTRDLAPLHCANCLSIAVGNFTDICYNSQGCRIIYKSCYVRYELYPFFFPLDLSNFSFCDDSS